MDTQELPPNGTPEQVMGKVKYLRAIFAAGHIISPSHEATQSNVPPASVKVMFAEAQKVY